MKVVPINQNVPLNKNGYNDNIKFHVLSERIMNISGFHCTYKQWVMCVGITSTVSLNILIDKDNQGKIFVSDDDLMIPYDFQGDIIRHGKDANIVSKKVQQVVYEILLDLTDYGIIEGWNYGDYI